MLIRNVHALFYKLRYFISVGKLQQFANMVAIHNNVTRFSSTYERLRRYRQIREFVAYMNRPEVAIILPSNDDNDIIEKHFSKIADLDSLKKSQQSDKGALAQVRVRFDAVSCGNAETVTLLGKDASIFNSPVFENS